MDLSAPFREDVFKPIATIVIPGTAATGPYVLHLTREIPWISELFGNHEITFTTIFMLAVVAVGFVLEDLGAQIEDCLWDRIQKNPEELKDIWWEYLRTVFKEEPVGQHYLRSIVLRMKFELSFALSLIPMWMGLLTLSTFDPLLPGNWPWYLTPVVMALFVYLLWESYQSSILLAKIRKELVKGNIVRP